MSDSSHGPLPANNTDCTTFITRGQTIGLFVAAEVGLASGIAVLFLFGKIARNVFRHVPSRDWRFFNSPLDVYMISLLLSDLLQALGGILDFKWVVQGSVTCGTSCTTQGIVQQLGETGVSMATLESIYAIAVHTFFIIFFRKGMRAMLLATVIVCIIWLYVIIFVVVNLVKRGDDFYTPTPYWCWVGARFAKERIAGEYFWLWFTAILSLGLYVPLFFCLRGNIIVDADGWRVRFRRQPHKSIRDSFNEDQSQMGHNPTREALVMLLYPISYIAIVAPLSIGRWIEFSLQAHGRDIPPAVAFTVVSIFGLSGLVNVVLLIWTRPGLLHLSEVPRAPSISDSEESPIERVDSQRLHMETSTQTNPFPPVSSESHVD